MDKNIFVSMIVISYNQEDMIEEALCGAVSQDYENMEIIVGDDCSTDNTQNVIESFIKKYKGNKKIHFFKNNKNEGTLKLASKLTKLATGEWIIKCDGDDISLPNRVTEIMGMLKKYPNAAGAGSGLLNMTDNKYFNFNPFLFGATEVWNRKCFDVFGDVFDRFMSDDITMSFRMLLLGGICITNRATVRYRIHSNNISTPILSSYIDKNRHLLKLRKRILNSCKQRLIDLDVVKDNLKIEKYDFLKNEHLKIIEDLKTEIKQLDLICNVFESNIIKRFKYLFNGNVLGKHNHFMYRLKIFLLSFNLIQKIHSLCCKSNPRVEYKEDSSTIFYSINDLGKDDIGMYIKL